MSDIKLLSCPICGREVYIGTEDYDDNIEDVIICDHCNLKFYGSYPATKQDLAEEWNARKPMERIIERLTEKIEQHYKLSLDERLEQSEQIVQNRQSNCFFNARKIVKEEGMINDRF